MTPDDRLEAQARQGLAAWAAFPADRRPRPVVLLDPAVRPGGFPDAQKKLAFVHGPIEAVPGFPIPVLEALRAQAGDYAGTPLLLTAATLTSALFATDRGEQRLPAWDVRAQDVPEPILVLDPASSWQVWAPPDQEQRRSPHSAAMLGTDERTLTMRFIGSPRAGYTGARTLESGNAVALVYERTQRLARSGWYAETGVTREVTALLTRPLGNRVLLDMTGSPVSVTPEDRLAEGVHPWRHER